ncbi:MAG: HAMP domain-containing sensor histidine kinase [Myxococcota bacterium]
MPSLQHLRDVRAASVAALLVVVSSGLSWLVSPEMPVLHLVMGLLGGLGWGLVRRGYTSAGVMMAILAGLAYPWYGLGTPEASTTVVSEVGWLVLATSIAAVTLEPLLYAAFATGNSAVMLGLVSMQPGIDASARAALGCLLVVLFISGTFVAWQRRRTVAEVDERIRDLRAAERHAHERAAAAEAARERLERAHAELVTQARATVVGELSAAVGHEINNPLTAIVMATEELSAHEALDDGAGEALTLLRDATERCRTVVGRLLSHADLGDVSMGLVDLAHVASEALELSRWSLGRQGIRVDDQLEPPIPVTGNVAELRQIVFTILVHVAAREPARVVVRGHVRDDRAWLAIRDDAGPMNEDTRAAAFQPRVDGRSSPVVGLALCRTLVRRHGGHIALTSGEQGCTFIVDLPRAT